MTLQLASRRNRRSGIALGRILTAATVVISVLVLHTAATVVISVLVLHSHGAAALRSDGKSNRRTASVDCSQYQDTVQLSSSLTMRYTTILDSGTGPNGYLNAELVYSGQAWLGFGVSPNGLMVQNYAVVGQPGVSTGGANPRIYYLAGYPDTDVTVASSSLQQSLSNATIAQNSTHTVMTFSQRLDNGVGTAINGTGANIFIWAYGSSNTLAYHAGRDSKVLTLTPCSSSSSTSGNPAPTAPTTPTTSNPPPSSPTAPASSPVSSPTGNNSTTSNNGTTAPTTSSDTVDCAEFQQFYSVDQLSTSFTSQLDNEVGPNGWLRVEVVYNGLAWVAFGIASSDRGRMVPGQAIIGLPGDSSVGKYAMNGYSQSAVQLMPSSQQTLANASITQNSTHTILRFSKRLIESSLGSNEYDINGNGQNALLLAYGFSNTLSTHQYRNSFAYTLSSCINGQAPNANAGGATSLSGSSQQTLWKLHGFFAAMAWGILAPLGIGASLCRRFFLRMEMPAAWFKIHFYVQNSVIVFTLLSVGLAIAAVQKEGGNHFQDDEHQVTGLVIVILAVLQGLAGWLRPHLPHKPHDDDDHNHDEAHKDSETDQDAEDGFDTPDKRVGGIVTSTSNTPPEEEEEPKKSTLRVVWEIGHRVVGLGLLGFCWFQVSDGLGLYSERYSEKNASAVFWGITLGLSGVIAILYLTKYTGC